MKNKIETRGRKRKTDNSDIPDLVKGFTRKQLEQIAENYVKEKREKSNGELDEVKETLSAFSITEKAKLLGICRSNFYKKRKVRTYKYDKHKQIIIESFNKYMKRFGRERLSAVLSLEYGVEINERTLGHYLNRYGCITTTRVAKRKGEKKNTRAIYADIVKRDFNPIADNIIATDVSYIPANEKQNFVYLSISINHKTKEIESWEISRNNDVELVAKTLSPLKERDNMIVHSDHGFQYSNKILVELAKRKNYSISMSRVGNSLDNREAEYFFSCIKGECLNLINTRSMNLSEIRKIISEYINWYNYDRIQKRLNWKTPAFASAQLA